MPLGSAGVGSAGLLQRQAEAIRQMLNFNSNTTQNIGVRSANLGVEIHRKIIVSLLLIFLFCFSFNLISYDLTFI